MSNIVLARLGENIKASVAGNILVSSGPTTAPTLNALVGSIALFAGTTAPTGWLKCDGTGGLLRSGPTGYPNLWAFANSSNNIVDETTWNAGRIGSFSTGNGTTTFRIPDLRGEFVRALADGKAVDTSRVIGTAQTDAFQNITGELFTASGGTKYSSNEFMFGEEQLTTTGAFTITHNTGNYFQPSTLTSRDPESVGGIGFNAANSPGARTSTETRPRNIALLYCIKY